MHFTWAEFIVTVQATFLRTILAFVFRFLPYRIWRQMILSALQMSKPVRENPARVETALRCVARTDRFGPGRCLERSMTAWLMIRRHTVCCMRLAVAFESKGDPFAHACIEQGGRIVFGEPRQASMVMLKGDLIPVSEHPPE